jgi:hypothetical protein
MKKLSVAVGTYQKDGQEKTEWRTIGTVFEKDGKMSIGLDPVFDIAGLYLKQCQTAEAQGKKVGKMLYAQIFDDEQQQAPRQTQAQAQTQAPNPDRFSYSEDTTF